ncbi:MAG: hypothetical protein SFY32_12950 [Bacteroidota bacterium]|nr:hypothetical protein [Bacteroidota bacterium]
MNKDIYQLKVIYTDASNKTEKKPYRIIQFHKDTNLLQLAQHLLKSFGFKVSEPFGFYDNLENWSKSKNKFELFEEDPKKNTLKNTFVDDFFEVKKEFLLIYDYLEEYRFLIFFEKMVPERNVQYPDVIESMGEMRSESETVLDDDDDDESNSKYGVKKQTGGFKDEFEDVEDDELDGLSKSGDIDGDSDDEPFEEVDDEFGFDELSEGKEEDDLR